MPLPDTTRSWVLYALRLVVGMAILVACFTMLDVSALPAALDRAQPALLLLALLLSIVGSIILPAMVTRRALEIERIRLTLGDIIVINFAVRFYALILPRALSYGYRWFRYKKGGSGHDAAALMVYEQLTQLFTMSAVAVIVLGFEHSRLGSEGFGIFVFMLAATASLGAALTPFVFPRAARWLSWLAIVGDRVAPAFVARRIHRLLDAVRAFHNLRTGTSFSIILLSLLGYAMIVLMWWVVVDAIRIDIPMSAILWIRAVVFLLLLSPITVAGIGVREAAIVGLMHLYGVPAHEALAFSLTLLGVQIAIGLMGAAIELWRHAFGTHPSV